MLGASDGDLEISASARRFDSSDHRGHPTLNLRPAGGHQHHDRERAAIELLLIPKVGVGRNEYLESLSLRGGDKIAILERAPALLVGRDDRVSRQEFSELWMAYNSISPLHTSALCCC